VLRVAADGGEAVCEVEAPHEEFGLFRAVSFWTVEEGLTVRGRGCWTSVGADPRPERRAVLTEPVRSGASA
jgi:hypothetical protein